MVGELSWLTELGPPERIIPFGFLLDIALSSLLGVIILVGTPILSILLLIK
jgi:hypothetical protein